MEENMKGARYCTERGMINLMDISHCGNKECESCESLSKAFLEVAKTAFTNLGYGGCSCPCHIPGNRMMHMTPCCYPNYPGVGGTTFKIVLNEKWVRDDDPTLGDLLNEETPSE